MAEKIVITIFNQVSPYDGFGPIAASLSADGKVARALMIARTGQKFEDVTLADGCMTINAGIPQRIDIPLEYLLKEGKQLDLSWESTGGLRSSLEGTGALGDQLQRHGLRTAALGSAEALAVVMNSEGRADIVDSKLLTATTASLKRAKKLLEDCDVLVIDASIMWLQDDMAAIQWLKNFYAICPASTSFLLCSPVPPDVSGVNYPASWVILFPVAKKSMTLYSPSTRRAGIVVNTDMASTIMALLDKDVTVGYGRAVITTERKTASQLLAMNHALESRTRLRSPIFIRYANSLAIILLFASLLLFGLNGKHHNFIKRSIRIIALIITASWLLLSLTGIMPTSARALMIEFSAGALLAALLAVLFRHHRILCYWVTIALAIVICCNLFVDWPLYNTASYLVLKDSRFYGLGNPLAGLVTAGALALCILGQKWSPRMRLATTMVPWLAAAWIISGQGAANFGMGIASAVMAMVITIYRIPLEKRLRWSVVIIVSMVVLLSAFIWYDYSSGSGTHVTQLVLSISKDGMVPLFEVVLRKGSMAIRLLHGSSFSLVLAAALLAIFSFLIKTVPFWRGNVQSGLLFWGGFSAIAASLLLNDSGVEPAAILAVFIFTSMASLYFQAEKDHVAEMK